MELNRRMSLYNWGIHKSTFNFNSETKEEHQRESILQ